MILTVDLRKMNEWLQQIRAEGLRIVYVTMGNVAEEGSIQPLFLDWGFSAEITKTPEVFHITREKLPKPNRKGSSSNHHFSRVSC